MPTIPADIRDSGVDVDISRNKLDDMTSSTYHFTFSILKEGSLRSPGNNEQSVNHITSDDKIIIAESGSTSNGIENVEIESFVGMSSKNSSGLSTKFDITISQPHAVDLIDQIHSAAILLGIKNYLHATYLLELRFKGNIANDDTNPYGDVVWTWPLFVKGVNFEVDGGGSKYQIESYIYSDLGYQNEYGSTSSSFSEAVSTVGEFFNKFSNSLNREAARKTIDNDYIIPDTYEFDLDDPIVGDSIKESKIRSDLTDQRSPLDTIQFNIDDEEESDNSDKITVTVNDNTSIVRASEIILTGSQYFTDQAKKWREDFKQQLDNPENDEFSDKDVFKKLFRVYVDVYEDRFDPGRNTYSRRFVYRIRQYETAKPLATVEEIENHEQSEVSINRTKQILRAGRVRKRYDFLYSGRSDQLLDFDLSFNNAWYASLPESLGRSGRLDSESPGPLNNPILEQARAVNRQNRLKQLNDIIANIDESDFSQILNFDVSDDDFPEEIQEVTSILQEGIEQDVLTVDDLNSISQQIGIPPTVLVDPSLIINRSQPNAASLSRSNIRNSSDALTYVRQNVSSGVFQSYRSNINRIPITFLEDNSERTNDGIVQLPDANVSIVSAIFTQAILTGLTSDLMAIDMTIKGDPYWLEPRPVPDDQDKLMIRPTSGKDLEENPLIRDGGSEYANHRLNEEFIFFYTRNPVEYDIESGVVDITDDNIINGLYYVFKVVHNFSNGRFTQNLECTRLPHVYIPGDIEDLLDEIRQEQQQTEDD